MAGTVYFINNFESNFVYKLNRPYRITHPALTQQVKKISGFDLKQYISSKLVKVTDPKMLDSEDYVVRKAPNSQRLYIKIDNYNSDQNLKELINNSLEVIDMRTDGVIGTGCFPAYNQIENSGTYIVVDLKADGMTLEQFTQIENKTNFNMYEV